MKCTRYYDIANEAPEVGHPIYIPQHPDGRDKSIGIVDSNLDSGFCEVVEYEENEEGYGHLDMIYTCDTQGGSSGSPVVDKINPYMVLGINYAGKHDECAGGVGTPMSEIFPHVNEIVYDGDYYDEECQEYGHDQGNDQGHDEDEDEDEGHDEGGDDDDDE